MTSLNTDFRTAVELTAAARAEVDAIEGTLPMSAYLPVEENDTLTYSFQAGGKVDVDMATFRAFDTPAPYGKTEGGETKSGKLLAISRKLPISEYDELQFARRTDQLGTVLERYAARLGRGIAFRLETARIEVILTGRLAINENGVVQTIDYGRNAALSVAAQWSAAASTPVDDIIDWRQTVSTYGRTPTAALLTLDVMEMLSKNEQVIGYALGRTDNLPGRVSYDDVRGVLGSFGIVNVTVVDEAYSAYDLGGQVFPAGTFVLVPGASGALGTTQVGVPAEASQDSFGIPASERAGVFAGAFDRGDPIGLDVLASAIALPVFTNVDSTLSASIS